MPAVVFTARDWKNAFEGAQTPLTAEAMEDQEARLAAYTDARIGEFASARYTGTYFGGDDAAGQKMFMAVSSDMNVWRPHGPPVATASSPAVLRDPDVIDYAGTLWMAHTHAAIGGSATGFGLQRSTFGGLVWIPMTDVSMVGAGTLLSGTINRVLVDQWFTDPSGGRPWLFLSVSVNGDTGPFKRIAIQPTNDTFTAWSTPVLCSSGLPTDSRDYSPILIGTTWHVFVSDNSTDKIVRATGSSYLGPWTIQSSDVVTSMAQIDSCLVIQKDDGTYRLYFDHYVESPAAITDQITNPDIDGWRFRAATMYYVESSDGVTWGSPVAVPGLGRHARVHPIRTINMGWLADAAQTSRADIRRVASLSRTSGDLSVISLDTATEDTDGMWVSSRPDVCIIRNAGLYFVEVYGVFNGSATGAGQRYAEAHVNNVSMSGLSDKREALLNVDSHVHAGSVLRLRRGDEVRMTVYQNSGAALTLLTAPAPALKITAVGI